MKFNLFIILYVLLLSACDSKKSSSETLNQPNAYASDKVTVNIGGTYFFGENIEKESVGTLLIYPITPQSALFFLDISASAPSYNSGQLFGMMRIEDNIGIYESDDKLCILKFKFQGREVKVLSGKTDDFCGFGNGVVAENTYFLKDSSKPEYFISAGDTIFFEGLTVEKYYQRFN